MKFFKLLFATLSFSLATFCYSYEMDIPKRYFEIGFDTNIGLSNNYFAAKEMLVEELVIDFTKISNEISDDGLVLNFLASGGFFSNLNLNNGMSFGFSFGVDGSGFGKISKDLFDFLGKGNSLGQPLSVGCDGEGDVFTYFDTSYQFDLGDFGVKVGAGFFVPMMHVELKDVTARMENGESGSLDASITGALNAYGCGDLQNIFDTLDVAGFVEGIKQGWGFDISGSVEHAILASLQGRVYMRLPIVPGCMNHKMTASVSSNYHADDFVSLFDGNVSASSFDISDKVYSSEKFYLARPFRTGYEIKWRPFGKYVSFNHQLGFGVKYPWTADARAYIEYNFGFEASIFNIIGVSAFSSYQREVFVQQAGVMLNLRILEIDAGVSLQGASFEKSWLGSGVGAYFGITMGF